MINHVFHLNAPAANSPTSLANDAWIAPIIVDVGGDVLPQLLENERASGKVQRGELAVRDGLRDHFQWRSRHELDGAWGNAGFGEDLVYDVIRIRCCGRGLPDDDIANQSRCYIGNKRERSEGQGWRIGDSDRREDYRQWR
jgi:hypothetical protein